MKKFLIVVGFALISAEGSAQTNEKKIHHQFEFALEAATIIYNSYSKPYLWNGSNLGTTRNGPSFSSNLKYSLSIKKWFIDLNLNLKRNYSSSEEVYEYNNILSKLEFQNRLNYFCPEISFGRFIRPAKSFRLSLSLGFGTSILLNNDDQNFVIVDWLYNDFYDFYEGNVGYLHDVRLSASAQIGIYILLVNNELFIKIYASGNSSTGSYLTLNKVVDYIPVQIHYGRSGTSGNLMGISIGYRFNTLKFSHKNKLEK